MYPQFHCILRRGIAQPLSKLRILDRAMIIDPLRVAALTLPYCAAKTWCKLLQGQLAQPYSGAGCASLAL
jgi:hypothetical protein